MQKRTTSRAVNRGEEIEQARFVRWTHKGAVRALMPALAWMFHVPNGGQRDGFTGAQLKAMGVKAGVPDLLLPWRVPGTVGPSLDGDVLGLVIEFKSATGRVSDAQKPWLAHFEAQGWEIRVARSAQEARTQVCQYLGITPKDAPPLDE